MEDPFCDACSILKLDDLTGRHAIGGQGGAETAPAMPAAARREAAERPDVVTRLLTPLPRRPWELLRGVQALRQAVQLSLRPPTMGR